MLYVGPEILMPLASAAVAAAGAALMFGRRVVEKIRTAGSTLRRPFARPSRPARAPAGAVRQRPPGRTDRKGRPRRRRTGPR